MQLSDRDVFAVFQVLEKVIQADNNFFEGARHCRTVFLQLQQYVEKKTKEEGSDYQERLKINL